MFHGYHDEKWVIALEKTQMQSLIGISLDVFEKLYNIQRKIPMMEPFFPKLKVKICLKTFFIERLSIAVPRNAFIKRIIQKANIEMCFFFYTFFVHISIL